jgi:hypothetical protein
MTVLFLLLGMAIAITKVKVIFVTSIIIFQYLCREKLGFLFLYRENKYTSMRQKSSLLGRAIYDSSSNNASKPRYPLTTRVISIPPAMGR